nr:hypothetical protein [Nonomuraea lactucae]
MEVFVLTGPRYGLRPLTPNELLTDVDLAALEVDLVQPEAEDLSAPQSTTGRKVNGNREARRQSLSKDVDLFRGRDEVGVPFDLREADAYARRDTDGPIYHSRCEERSDVAVNDRQGRGCNESTSVRSLTQARMCDGRTSAIRR